MKFTPIDSSMIEAVAYDEDSQLLTVRFNSGRAYEYYEVEKEVYEGLLNASSAGSYFQYEIRGVYSYLQIR